MRVSSSACAEAAVGAFGAGGQFAEWAYADVDGGEVWRADLDEAVVLVYGVVRVEDVECGDEGAAIARVDDAHGVGETEGRFGEAGSGVEVVAGGFLMVGRCAHHGRDLVIEFEERGGGGGEVAVVWDKEVEARVFVGRAFLVAGVVYVGVGFVLGVEGFKVSLGSFVFFACGGGEDVEVKVVVVVCGALCAMWCAMWCAMYCAM